MLCNLYLFTDNMQIETITGIERVYRQRKYIYIQKNIELDALDLKPFLLLTA